MMILNKLKAIGLKEGHYYFVKINGKLELQEEVLLSTLNKNKVTGIMRLSTKN